MQLEVRQTAGALGAEVTGIDLRKVDDAGELKDLRRALAEHLVVFLPEQHLDLDDLERVTDLLGGRDSTGARREMFRTSVRGGEPRAATWDGG